MEVKQFKQLKSGTCSVLALLRILKNAMNNIKKTEEDLALHQIPTLN